MKKLGNFVRGRKLVKNSILLDLLLKRQTFLLPQSNVHVGASSMLLAALITWMSADRDIIPHYHAALQVL